MDRRRKLAAGIDHEIERACMIDLHGNHNEDALNEPRGYTGGASRASRQGSAYGMDD
jgi:hypothetical protein